MNRSAFAQETFLPTAWQRPVWAWLMSILLHLMLLTAVGLYAGRSSHDTLSEHERDRPVSVAMVHRLPDRQELQSDPAAVESSPSASAASESSNRSVPIVPPDFAPPIDLAGVLAEMTAVVEPDAATGAGSGEIAGTPLLGGFGDAQAGPGDRGFRAASEGSKGTASLFGVSGSGSRFVYVVDRSDSMNDLGGRPLRAAKAELKRSLEMLTESQFFQLVLYNDQPRPYRGGTVSGGPVQMLQGQRSIIGPAQRYVDSLEAFGGTNHFDALRLALRMGPDVIFFLTDGHVPSLSGQEMADVRHLAERSGTTIHAIEFGTEPAPHPHTFVRHLAGENRGEYRYFDVRRFSDSGTWQGEAAEPDPGKIPASVAPGR